MATRGRKSKEELGAAVTLTVAAITFAQEKAVEFYGRYTQDLRPAEEALTKARSTTAQSIMDMGVKAYTLASAAGYGGKGQTDPHWTLVPRYFNALLESFEQRLKELAGKTVLQEAFPSYPVMKSEVLGHMKQGPYVLTIEKRADGTLIPSDERKISTGNPKDTGGYSDMVKRTKQVRGYTRQAQSGSQTPAAPADTAATTAGESRIAVNDKTPASITKCANDVLREINAVARWTPGMIEAALVALMACRQTIGTLTPETNKDELSKLVDERIAERSKEETLPDAKPDTAIAQAMKQAEAKAPKRSRKGTKSLKEAA